MDRVRFGRALGFGARQAMKTLVTAVAAAAAENPGATKGPWGTASRQGSASTSAALPFGIEAPAIQPQAGARNAANSAVTAVTLARAQTRQAKQRLGGDGKRLGTAVWEPLVRLSGVLWLEVTGVFFGLFALVALGYLWKLRAAWHAEAGAASQHSLLGAAIMFVLFGYFSVSSFVRARRRERRR